MTTWAEYQSSLNRESEAWWEHYAPHRERVTAIIADAARRIPRGERRAQVLGAGNGNDIDLGYLASLLDHLTLTDIDPTALERARERHRLTNEPTVDAVTADLLAEDFSMRHPRRYDLVVSAGVLTQLLDHVIQTAKRRAGNDADSHLLATRNRHLQLLDDLSTPDARRILITDVVSSATCPQLLTHPRADELRLILETCLRSRNFFSGTNPIAMRRHLEALGHDGVHFVGPWLWQIGGTVRLAYGMSWQESRGNLRRERTHRVNHSFRHH